MRFAILTGFLVVLPTFVLSVGPDDHDDPPIQTETTKTCSGGLVWNPDTRRCVQPQDAGLSDDHRLKAVRELAHFGAPDQAEIVLNSVTEQSTDAVYSYRGFLARKQGRHQEAHQWYAKAIAQNPNNLLARSYWGQAHVLAGDFDLARMQLREIRLRGGRETWPEIALRMALRSGHASGY